MHLVSTRKLGVPKASRESFQLLEEAGVIDANLSEILKNMVSFRKIAVHDYQALELSILEKHLDEFKKYTHIILKLENTK